MDPDGDTNTDSLLQDLGGCGRFQIYLVLLIQLVTIPDLFGFLVDSFVIYNPGWRCLDNLTTTTTAPLPWTSSSSWPSIHDNFTTVSTVINATVTYNDTSQDYGHYSCDLYEACENVEFLPGTKTLVTEWGLTCDKGWIMSTILALRMFGNLSSTLFIGYLGDRFGRRFPYLVYTVVQFVGMNVVSMFSTSWQMYGVVTFFMGCLGPFQMMADVIAFEYVTPKWRIRIKSLPSWSMVAILFAPVAMLTKDWRHLRLITAGIGLVIIPLLFWMPKSLRWLAVRGKEKEVLKVVTKIAKINKTDIPGDDHVLGLIKKDNDESESKKKTNKSYTVLHLFKKQGYLVPTFIVGFICFACDLLYFALSFSVISLPGNLYTNLIISSTTELPANIISFTVANAFTRKSSIFTLFLLVSLFLFGITAMELTAPSDIKEMGSIVLVMLAKLLLFIGWIIFVTSVSELYPTVIRTNVKSYMFFTSAVGGIIAPYLISTNPDTFYICYAVMAVVLGVCAVLVCFLPETKGKPLKDVWDDHPESDTKTGNGVV